MRVRHDVAVGRAAVIGIHSKVDAFAPHATVGVVYVETFLADHLRIAASCAVPQAVGC
jgi:hypothetical protein